MENQYLTNDKPKNEYFDQLINLITNINKAKRDKNYPEKVAKALICFKMADLGIQKIEFNLLDKKSGYIGSQQFNTINVNEKLLKFNAKNMVILLDCLLHEFSHKKTEIENRQIKKDEYGKANGEYVPKFCEQYVYLMLHWACNLELEDASTYSIALYSYDKNEQMANNQALIELLEILKLCKNETNKKIIDKMILLENKLFQKFIRKHHTKQNKFLVEQFNCQYKTNFLDFQFEFAKKPINTALNISKMQVARMLCPSVEADQKLFNYFLQKGNVDACIKIINQPDFKNTPNNLKALINLMQTNDVDLSRLTGIEKSAIQRVLNSNEFKPSFEKQTVAVNLQLSNTNNF